MLYKRNWEREFRKIDRNNLADTKREGRRCFSHQSTVLLQLMVCHVRENIQACGEPPAGEGPGLELQLVERRPQWGRRAAGATIHGDLCGNSALPKDGACGIESGCSSAWRTSVCGKPTQDQLGRTANHTGAGEESEDEVVASDEVLWTDLNSHSLSALLTGGSRRWVVGRCFKFALGSH